MFSHPLDAAPGAAEVTLTTLRAAGTLLYGEYWQSPLARDLGIALRSMQRMAAGQARLPPLEAELAELCEARGVELCALALTLKGGTLAEVGE